jgi:hypothetical protein
VAASVRQGDDRLDGAMCDSEEARKVYLWARRGFLATTRPPDPLLVTRRGPGELDLRVFPVASDRETVVTVHVYRLDAPPPTAPPGHGAKRIYRTGDRCMLVDGGLRFLSEEERAASFPGLPVLEVPCVPALETAWTGRGRDAAGEEVVVAALEPGSPPPPFVGEDHWVPLGSVPPGLREPSDPEPPPPPPDDAAPPAEQVAATAG